MINKTQNKVVVLTQAQFDAKYQADTLQENTEYKIIGDVPELPIPTTADNGKALTVNSSGKYALTTPVSDVQVNGTSVVTSGVANIQYNQTINITYSDGTTATLTLNGNLQ